MDAENINRDRLMDVISVAGLIGIGFVLSSVRREWIRAEYSVSWLLAAVVLLVLGRWKALDQWIGAALGVNDLALVLLLLIAAVFIVVLYRLSLIISTLRDSNIKLAQRIALLEFRLNAYEKTAS